MSIIGSLLRKAQGVDFKTDMSSEYIDELIQTPSEWFKVESKYHGAWIAKVPVGVAVYLNRSYIGTATNDINILFCNNQKLEFVKLTEVAEYVDDINSLHLDIEWQSVKVPLIRGEYYARHIPKEFNDFKRVCHAAITTGENANDCYVTAATISNMDSWIAWTPQRFHEVFEYAGAYDMKAGCEFPMQPSPIQIMNGQTYITFYNLE